MTSESHHKKVCSKCKTLKLHSEFYKDARVSDGLQPRCKHCHKSHIRKHRENNGDKVRARERSCYYERSTEARALRKQGYYRNREKFYARNAIRRASKLQATPLWVERSSIYQLYKRASELSAMGIVCHVDHIYPLQSEWVCGLHCFDNLQLLSPKENLGKGNRIDSASQRQ